VHLFFLLFAIYKHRTPPEWNSSAAPSQPVITGSTPSTTQQAAPASLTIISGFPTKPGTVNPLAGKPVIILRDNFDSVLSRAGWTSPALATWARSCETDPAACQRGIAAMPPAFVSNAQLDNSGGFVFQNARAGTFYLVLQTLYNGTHLVWNVRLEMKPGANSITLDQRNATPVR
jgi:hypothetical protein